MDKGKKRVTIKFKPKTPLKTPSHGGFVPFDWSPLATPGHGGAIPTPHGGFFELSEERRVKRLRLDTDADGNIILTLEEE